MKAHPRTPRGSVLLAFALFAVSIPAISQLAITSAINPPIVPQIATHSGIVLDRAGETVEMVFSLYSAPEGGDPLWNETQLVSVGQDGRYSVLLGSATEGGLPQTVFAGGSARWLGVSVERGVELSRVPFTSVPYAMKAADAQTLAGIPAADYVTRNQFAQLAKAAIQPAQSGASDFQPNTSGTVTGSGTANTVPLWTGALTQGNSEITQAGSDIGINETAPTATLDVNGTENVRGTLSFPAVTTANSTNAERSQLIQLSASVWSSTANAAVSPTFRLLTYPVNSNTANASGQLQVFFQQGTTDTKVLSIASNGVIGFAPSQTFPGTVGSVTASSPLTATTTSGVVALGLNTAALETSLNAVYPQLGAANTFTQPITFASGQTFPGTGVSAGNGLAYTDSAQFGETLLVDTSVVPLLASANDFTANQTVTVSAPGALGPILAVTNPGGGLNAAASVDFRTYLHTATAATPSARIMAVDDNNYGNNLYFLSKADGSDANGLEVNAEISSIGGLTAWGKTIITGNAGSGITGQGGGSSGSFQAGDGGQFFAGDAAGTGAGGAGVYGGGGSSAAGTGGDGGDFFGGSSNADRGSTPSAGAGGVFQGGTAPSSGNGGDGINVTVGEGGIYAGYFAGDVDVSGTLYASTKHFKIDHPLDPANKYLVHTSVESSEDMNIYTGNVVTDQAGNAVVNLPDWFQALNADFRYQLTVIGQFAQAIVSKEIENNQFEIRTNAPSVKVSWQVTGIRQDPYAKAHPLIVEEEKPGREQGFYIHPELYGQPAERQTEWGRHPQMMQRLKAARQQHGPNNEPPPTQGRTSVQATKDSGGPKR